MDSRLLVLGIIHEPPPLAGRVHTVPNGKQETSQTSRIKLLSYLHVCQFSFSLSLWTKSAGNWHASQTLKCREGNGTSPLVLWFSPCTAELTTQNFHFEQNNSVAAEAAAMSYSFSLALRRPATLHHQGSESLQLCMNDGPKGEEKCKLWSAWRSFECALHLFMYENRGILIGTLFFGVMGESPQHGAHELHNAYWPLSRHPFLESGLGQWDFCPVGFLIGRWRSDRLLREWFMQSIGSRRRHQI